MWLNQYRGYRMATSFNGASTKKLRKFAEYENELVFQNIFNTLLNIALNEFEWEGLPDTCEGRFIEEILMFHPVACVVQDSEYNGFLSLPCTPASSLNIYYEHPIYKAISLNYNKKFMAMTEYNRDIIIKMSRGSDIKKVPMMGCIIYDNPVHYPMIFIIEYYARAIATTLRSIQVVQHQLKVPKIIATTEETKTSIQHSIDNVDSNTLAIYVEPAIKRALDQSLDMETGTKAENLTVLWDSLNNWYSQALTALGVNNLNTSDKKERLLTDEVESNDDFVQLNSAYRLDMREHFCDNFNAVFGTNVKCKLRHDFQEEAMIQNMQSTESQKQKTGQTKGSDSK